MKNRSSNFLKHIISVLSSVAKAKSIAIKSKTDAMRARLIVFSLLKEKRLSFGGISHKIHALLGQQQQEKKSDDDHEEVIITVNNDSSSKKAIELYDNNNSNIHQSRLLEFGDDDHQTTPMEGNNYDLLHQLQYHDDDDNKYPDLRHSLFDDDNDDDLLGDPNASVIDLVRNSKEEDGEDFSLEDEIDHVADLFIQKFHKRMRMQKLESFKRYQEMLDRSTA